MTPSATGSDRASRAFSTATPAGSITSSASSLTTRSRPWPLRRSTIATSSRRPMPPASSRRSTTGGYRPSAFAVTGRSRCRRANWGATARRRGTDDHATRQTATTAAPAHPRHRPRRGDGPRRLRNRRRRRAARLGDPRRRRGRSRHVRGYRAGVRRVRGAVRRFVLRGGRVLPL